MALGSRRDGAFERALEVDRLESARPIRERFAIGHVTLQATTETQKTVPIAPIAGVGALVGGIALVIAGSRTRV